MKKMLCLLALALFSLPLQAVEQPQRPEVNPGNVPQEEVLIIPGDSVTLHEYRRDGQIYKIKVVPKKGRPYFLIDSDDNGSLDQMQWILVTW